MERDAAVAGYILPVRLVERVYKVTLLLPCVTGSKAAFRRFRTDHTECYNERTLERCAVGNLKGAKVGRG